MFFVFSLYDDKINLPTYLPTPQHRQKPDSSYKFSSKRAFGWCRSNNKKMPIFSRELLATMKKKEATVNF